MSPTRCPASSAQRGLWLTQALDPASAAYLIAHAYEIRGPVDVQAFQAAVADTARGRDACHGRFAADGEDLVFETDPAWADTCEPVELPAGAEPEAVVATLLAEERSTPFDLACAPLARFRLLRLSAQRHVFTVTVHHIVADGVSVAMLWSDIAARYAVATGAQASPVAEAAPFSSFAHVERDWLASAEHEVELDYWRNQLRGAPAAIDLPSRGTDDVAWRGGVHELWLSEVDTAALVALTRRLRVTPFMALLALFSGVLHRWCGQPDVVVGCPVAVRDLPGTAGLAANLVNTIALRTSWGDDPGFTTALDRALTATAEGLARRRVPFDHVVGALPRLRAPGRSPVVQVLFGYETDDGTGGPRLPGLDVRELPLAHDTAKFELSLDCVLTAGRVRCAFEWSDQRLDGETARLFAEHFAAAAEFVLAEPDAPVGSWPLDGPVEQAHVAWLDRTAIDPGWAAVP